MAPPSFSDLPPLPLVGGVQHLLNSYDFTAAARAYYNNDSDYTFALEVVLEAVPSVASFVTVVHHYLAAVGDATELERHSRDYELACPASHANLHLSVPPAATLEVDDDFLHLVWTPATESFFQQLPLTAPPFTPTFPLDEWTDTLFEHLEHFPWHPHGYPLPRTFPTRPTSTFTSAHRGCVYTGSPSGSPSPPASPVGCCCSEP